MLGISFLLTRFLPLSLYIEIKRYMEKEAIAKAWDWEKESKKEPWLTPEPIVYYLVSRWKGQGKKDYLDFGCGLGRHALFLHLEPRK